MVEFKCETIEVLRRLFQYVGKQGFYNVGGYFDSDLYETVKKLLEVKDCKQCPLNNRCIAYTYTF